MRFTEFEFELFMLLINIFTSDQNHYLDVKGERCERVESSDLHSRIVCCYLATAGKHRDVLQVVTGNQ
jgi:hypothetical protein